MQTPSKEVCEGSTGVGGQSSACAFLGDYGQLEVVELPIVCPGRAGKAWSLEFRGFWLLPFWAGPLIQNLNSDFSNVKAE